MAVRVLIVDDEPVTCETLGDVLEARGYIVDKAASGEEALKKMKRGGFEVALVDLKMPGMDGLSAYKEMRKIDRNLRIVLMTAYALESWVVLALKLGADGILYKPFDPDIVVRNILSKDVIEIYQGYFSVIWNRLKPIVGVANLVAILRDILSESASQEGSLLAHLQVSGEGVSFEKLKKELGDSRPPKLREELRGLIAKTFVDLDKRDSKTFSQPLARDLGEQLKGKQRLKTKREREEFNYGQDNSDSR